MFEKSGKKRTVRLKGNFLPPVGGGEKDPPPTKKRQHLGVSFFLLERKSVQELQKVGTIGQKGNLVYKPKKRPLEGKTGNKQIRSQRRKESPRNEVKLI